MSIELTPELAPEFAVTVRGYDRAQVDEYIDWLREWLSNATVRMESAEAEAAQLRDQLRRVQLRVDDLEAQSSEQPPRTIGALGERVTRILELAEEGAAALRADAESEAERLLSEARSEAESLARGTEQRQAELDSRLSSATERAQQTVQEAETRAAEAVSRQMLEAETRARAWEAQAEQRARNLVESAEQERARILEQSAAEKAALDAHLEGLVAQRAEVLASLSKLHESLASTIVKVPAEGDSTPEERPEADLDSVASGRDAPGTGAGAGEKGANEDRTVLFDREAVEAVEAVEVEGEPQPPAPPSFRRAGSQPEGSQRAGQ